MGQTALIVTRDRVTSISPANGPRVVLRTEPQRIALTTIGRAGPAGPEGPPGALGSDAHYTHIQSVASSDWLVSHGLGKYPSVQVFTSAGDRVCVDIRQVDLNNVRVQPTFPFTGAAHCN